jgi:predicted acyl esterase
LRKQLSIQERILRFWHKLQSLLPLHNGITVPLVSTSSWLDSFMGDQALLKISAHALVPN